MGRSTLYPVPVYLLMIHACRFHTREKSMITTRSTLKLSTMKNFSIVQKIVASVLSALLIIQFSGCRTLAPLPRNDIQYSEKNHYYIHGTNSSFEVSGTTIDNGIFTGIVSHPATKPAKGQLMHLYVAPDSVIKIDGQVISVPVSNIAKAEIYKVDAGKVVAIAAGTATGAFWTYIIIVLITKGISCPYVYSESATDVTLEGELYSGATATPIERDDYINLKAISPVDDQYKIRITNEVHEIQNTNLAELLVFDHPADAEVLVDKYGVAHSISDMAQPVSATDTYGKSILAELKDCDTKMHISEIRNDALLFDTISLSFERPAHSAQARLVISAKNTMWLDYMFARLSDMFGSRYDEWVKMRNRRSREDLLQWSLDQGIPLAVYLETNSGLKFVDYYNVPGPARYKKDVLQLDLSGVSGDRVNVKLVSGVMFWDLDYAGMDFTDDKDMAKTVVSMTCAADETGKEVSHLLRYDDDKYLVQPLINNEARLTYKAPPALPGTERTVILHSKGNYEPIRTATGKPDMKLLISMRQPGMFTRFTKDHFLKYYAGVNNMRN